ncbi:MAG: glycoside hydrolase family 3 N-terminal domain-containing protein [Bacillota bacterium]|nr:glycoside hydrolase family 3 N-terminal domain-containing protein [Bacillota bacterium]
MMPVYKDSSCSPEQRADDLLARMTLEEKIGQMIQISCSVASESEAEEWAAHRFAGSFLYAFGDTAKHLQELALSTRLGIPILFGIDAIHGHALNTGATVFPSQLSMSCSWNPELVQKAGRVTAKEVASEGLHWTFSPVLCLGRDLRWGRINETFGEDQYLAGILGAAIIKGYQGEHLADPDSILACAKHYIAYGESLGGRDSYDTSASMRKVREVFLPPFAEAVKAGCATMMASYQSVDGTPVSASEKLLKDLLKDELGFKGFVVTDWENVRNLVVRQGVAADMKEAAAKALNAGNDMIMNTPEFYYAAIELVKAGVVKESIIDQAVRRILFIKFALGLFDGKCRPQNNKHNTLACSEHLDINMKLTRESIVLLENRNNILPLKSNIKKIAVIGPNADDIQAQFGDWTYFSHPDLNPSAVPKIETWTVLRGIKELSSKYKAEVVYHKGCDIMDPEDQDIEGAARLASSADAVIAVIGDCLAQNGEYKDRADLDLSGSQQKLLEALKACGKPLIVVLVNGKPLSIPWAAKYSDALIEAFNSGMFGGKAVAEIIFGETNPSGRLSISFPYHSGQLPVYYNQLPGWHGAKYMDMPSEPLYSFGYGLSYTSFEYSNLKLSKNICNTDDTVAVNTDVRNTGSIDGMETVQLYVRDLASSVVTPVKQLKGFKKVEIKAGETVTIEIPLDIRELFIVNEAEEYVVEPGEFEIMVGPDSRDSVLHKTRLVVE